MRHYFVVLLFIASLISCNSNSNTNEGSKCMTQPSAIFSDTMLVVQEHSFDLKGQESVEAVTMRNGLKVEILQSGCKLAKQEYRIMINKDLTQLKDADWIAASFLTLGEISLSSPKLGGLKQYADFIAQNKAQVKLGQAFYPDPTFSIIVDKIATPEEATILLTFQEADIK